MNTSINTSAKVQTKTVVVEVTMPPGTYYLGDPCYAFPKEEYDPKKPLQRDLWGQWLTDANMDNDTNILIADVMCPDGVKRPVLGMGTSCGDGHYERRGGGKDHPGYGVDAGLIGLVPVELMDDTCSYNSGGHCGGEIITFEGPIKCRNHMGMLVFEEGDSSFSRANAVFAERGEELPFPGYGTKHDLIVIDTRF